MEKLFYILAELYCLENSHKFNYRKYHWYLLISINTSPFLISKSIYLIFEIALLFKTINLSQTQFFLVIIN